MAPLTNPSRTFQEVCAYWLISSAGSNASAQSQNPSTIASNIDTWVRDLYTHELERLTAPLAQYEKPKRFALLEKDFTFANGELTYTMKLKRRVIEERYQDVIARLYADVEEPRPQRTA